MDENVKTVAEAAPKLNTEDCPISAEETVETIEAETTRRPSPNPSEYDSADADSYSDGDAEQGEQSRRSHNSETDSDRSVVLEREEGDGQESAPTRKIDDDEDKKNPQYIPKRGTFYEHDDRTVEDDEENPEEKEKAEKDGKKKIWTDKKEKWNHDKFNDNDQAPKSRSELIAIYGYDIRNEDGPPRARRRRRYGRGPNKYTRNWEDEDAYSKPPVVVIKKVIKKNKQNTKQENETDTQDTRSSDESHSNSQQHIEREHNRSPSSEPPSQSLSQLSISKPREASKSSTPVYNDRQNNKNQRVGTGRVGAKPSRESREVKEPDYRGAKPSREIKDSDYRGFTKPRQYGAKPPLKDIPRDRGEPVHSQSFTNKKNLPDDRDYNRMNNQEHGKNMMKHNNNNRQTSVPPRLQGEQKGSKRYSSLRQRSLPESVTPPFNQQQHAYYTNVYFNQQYSLVRNLQQQRQQQIIHSNGPIHSNQAQIPKLPLHPLPTIPEEVPLTTPLCPRFEGMFPQTPPPFLRAPPFTTKPKTLPLNHGQADFNQQNPVIKNQQQEPPHQVVHPESPEIPTPSVPTILQQDPVTIPQPPEIPARPLLTISQEVPVTTSQPPEIPTPPPEIPTSPPEIPTPPPEIPTPPLPTIPQEVPFITPQPPQIPSPSSPSISQEVSVNTPQPSEIPTPLPPSIPQEVSEILTSTLALPTKHLQVPVTTTQSLEIPIPPLPTIPQQTQVSIPISPELENPLPQTPPFIPELMTPLIINIQANINQQNQQPPQQMILPSGPIQLNSAQIPEIPSLPLSSVPEQIPDSTPLLPQFEGPFPHVDSPILQAAPSPFISQPKVPIVNRSQADLNQQDPIAADQQQLLLQQIINPSGSIHLKAQTPEIPIPQLIPVSTSLPPQHEGPFPQTPMPFLEATPPICIPETMVPLINKVLADLNQQDPIAADQQQLLLQQIINPSGPIHLKAQTPEIPIIPQLIPVSTSLPPQYEGPFPQTPMPFLEATPPICIPETMVPLINKVLADLNQQDPIAADQQQLLLQQIINPSGPIHLKAQTPEIPMPLPTIPQLIPVSTSLPPQSEGPFPQTPMPFLEATPPICIPETMVPLINKVLADLNQQDPIAADQQQLLLQQIINPSGPIHLKAQTPEIPMPLPTIPQLIPVSTSLPSQSEGPFPQTPMLFLEDTPPICIPETMVPLINKVLADFNQQNPVVTNQQQQQPQQIIHPSGPIHPNPAQMPAIPPPPLPSIPQQVPVTTPLPPQFGGPFPQAPPPFLQAAPPPFIPQPTPPLINYVQGQPQFAPPPAPYQSYQQTFTQAQPAEIFQPPGGITYYSAQDQQAAQRAALQKRPKAAIPIIAPPGPEPRGRGRSNTQEVPSPNSCDLIQSEINIENCNYEDIVVQQ